MAEMVVLHAGTLPQLLAMIRQAARAGTDVQCDVAALPPEWLAPLFAEARHRGLEPIALVRSVAEIAQVRAPAVAARSYALTPEGRHRLDLLRALDRKAEVIR